MKEIIHKITSNVPCEIQKRQHGTQGDIHTSSKNYKMRVVSDNPSPKSIQITMDKTGCLENKASILWDQYYSEHSINKGLI
jgi:hypothetical protein